MKTNIVLVGCFIFSIVLLATHYESPSSAESKNKLKLENAFLAGRILGNCESLKIAGGSNSMTYKEICEKYNGFEAWYASDRRAK